MIGNSKSIIQWLLKQDQEKMYEIKEYADKRTLTANSYYWSLLNKLANVLRLSKEELHFKILKDYGQSELVKMDNKVNPEHYFKYYEPYAEKDNCTYYKIYQQSSLMDNKEFAVLLDGLIEECKNQDIETMTPDELLKLKGLEEKGN